MTATIEQYKRRLKRHLRCDSLTKQRLMSRFEGMLNVYLGDFGWPASWPGKQDLENAFGTPEQMAEFFMEEIPADVIARCRRKRRIFQITIVVISLALLVYIAYLLRFR